MTTPTAPPPANPWLADSAYPIAHGRCDQQDNSPVAGPTGPTETLGPDDIQYTWIGPGHFGGFISPPYPDGRRVIWSNGRNEIVKLDHDSLELLAVHPVGPGRSPTVPEMLEAVGGLDSLDGDALIEHAIGLALRDMTGLDGVYAAVDRDNVLYVGRKEGVVAFTDADPADPTSPIVEARRWPRPPGIEGLFVGLNMTFDGWLVLTTDHGWVVALARDFSTYHAVRLPGAEAAAAHCARMAAERGHTGYGWVRTSCCVGDDGGIYVSSVDHTHKVMWTGEGLSLDPVDGAWSAPYRNGTGVGSGTTPSLMGFGPDDDRFVVIGDGDPVVGITLFWRDEIPDDWEQLPGAPSRRIAGIGAANMGDPDRVAVQTEQSITVSGYRAMTVDNEPARVPEGFDAGRARLFAFYLGHRPEYTPHGMHAFAWDPVARRFGHDWVTREVASPNSVPFVSEGSDLVYTCGARDGRWTIEAVNWSSGEPVFHYVTGDSRFNTLGAGVTLDGDGHLLFGTIFGKARILR